MKIEEWERILFSIIKSNLLTNFHHIQPRGICFMPVQYPPSGSKKYVSSMQPSEPD